VHIDTIREALHRQPFQPFHLRTADGRAILVAHPDFVAIAPRTLIVISAVDNSIQWLEPLLVQGVEFPDPAPGSAPPSTAAG